MQYHEGTRGTDDPRLGELRLNSTVGNLTNEQGVLRAVNTLTHLGAKWNNVQTATERIK